MITAAERPIKVLIVTPWYPTVAAPESGIFVARDAAALADAAHVSVLHLDWNHDPQPIPDADFRIAVTRVRLTRRDPRAYIRARKLVRAHALNADIVHTHALPGLIPFLLGRPAGKRQPWVHTEHWSGLTAPETLSRVERIMRRLLIPVLRRPEVVVVACSRLAGPIGALRGDGRLAVVPCVVEPAERIVDPPHDPEMLQLVGIGGLIERKGPRVAVATLAELEKRGIRASLTWVGDGSQREAVLADAELLGITDRVRLTGGLRPPQVRAELDRADMFVLPTLGDNFCIVVAEALTHGRPVVSGAETGAVDYSRPEVSEFVSEQTPSAYAAAIARLRERTATLSAEDVAATVRGAFTPAVVAEKLVAVYRSLLGARRA